MGTGLNKGFKGIDRRLGQGATDSNRQEGLNAIDNQFLQRNANKDQSYRWYPPYTVQPEDFVRTGWSASFKEGSGSLLFQSPSTIYGTAWSAMSCYTQPELKVQGRPGILNDAFAAEQTASVRWTVGNSINGNGNGSWYGFWGLYDPVSSGWAVVNTIDASATDSPPFDYASFPYRGGWADSNDRISIYEQGAGLGNNTVNQGDEIEIRIYGTGMVQYFINGALFTTSATLIEEDPGNAAFWKFGFQSAQEGASAQTNFGLYNIKLCGEVDMNPYFFNVQFEQSMSNMRPTGWASSSTTPGITIRTSPSGGTYMRGQSGGSYSEHVWNSQYITGSGYGGIYLLNTPSASADVSYYWMVSVADKVNPDADNYWTQLCGFTANSAAWSGDIMTGSGHAQAPRRADGWYQWSNVGAAGSQQVKNVAKYPWTTGSKVALIVTGSKSNIFGNLVLPRSNHNPFAEPVEWTIGAVLVKPEDHQGNGATAYMSPHWQLHTWGPYGNPGTGSMRFDSYNWSGQAGDEWTRLQVGNWQEE